MPNILEKLSSRLDLPAEAAAGAPKVTLTGTGQALVENHRGILSYTNTEVEVDARTHRIRIRGSELLLRAMDSEMLLVTGQIFGVDME